MGPKTEKDLLPKVSREKQKVKVEMGCTCGGRVGVGGEGGGGKMARQ